MNIKIPMTTASLESQKAVIDAFTAVWAAINYSTGMIVRLCDTWIYFDYYQYHERAASGAQHLIASIVANIIDDAVYSTLYSSQTSVQYMKILFFVAL